MTDDPRRGVPQRPGWRNLWLAGPVALAAMGTVANAIQILTAGEITTRGVVTAGFIVIVALLPVAYQRGRTAAALESHAEIAVVASAVADSAVAVTQLTARVQELELTGNILDTTLAAYAPYYDERTVVFHIGDGPQGDHIEETHVTEPLHGPNAYWCHFEAISRGRDHLLHWDDIGLDVGRHAEDPQVPQQVSVVELLRYPARALITFGPPAKKVTWWAKYRSPGYWDELRRGAQKFSWIPPAVGLDEEFDEENGRRSPVRAITFVFQVAPAFGRLIQPASPPPGVEFRQDRRTGRYTYTIREVEKLPGARDAPIEPVSWYLEFERGGAS